MLVKAPLSSTHPDLVALWHPTKNEALTPSLVSAGTHKKVWWQCPAGPDHEWQATVRDRVRRGDGCPFCSGRRATAETSLVATHPELVSQWHPTKNGDLTPDLVSAGSGRRVWWTCPEGPDHVWAAVVISRARLGTGCPCCAGKQASVTNSLATQAPEVAAQWHPTKNGDLTPDRVPVGTAQSAWWQCPTAPDHVWRDSRQPHQEASANWLPILPRAPSLLH
jgi:hypothetical protein